MYQSPHRQSGRAFNDFERLRRELGGIFGVAATPVSVRAATPNTYPAINVGHTAHSVEVQAFAPGIDPTKIEVTLDRGVLTLAGERVPTLTEGADGQASVISRERQIGRFQRSVSLPDDVDPQQVQARYRDGVLHVSIARREAPKPQRIVVQ
jgi:HSP20 family protein